MIKEILKNNFLKYKRNIYEAFDKDSLTCGIKLNFDKFLKIIEELDEKKIIEDKQNYIVFYNANPYITLKIAIKSIISKSNSILITKEEMINSNMEIIRIITEVIKKLNLESIIKLYQNVNIDKIISEKQIINKIIYIGDKFQYRKLKQKTNIPIVFNPYGSILIYTDDEDEFEEEINKIKEYAFENNIIVDMYYDEINLEIERMNKDGKNDICIIFSKNEEKVKLFEKKVNSRIIYTNKFIEET